MNGENITNETDDPPNIIMERTFNHLNDGHEFVPIGPWIIRVRDIRYIYVGFEIGDPTLKG